MEDTTYLYRFFDENNVMLFLGETDVLIDGIPESLKHITETFNRDVKIVEIARYYCSATRNLMKDYCVSKYKPIFNTDIIDDFNVGLNLDYAEERWVEYIVIDGDFVTINLGNEVVFKQKELPCGVSFQLSGIFYNLLMLLQNEDNMLYLDSDTPATSDDIESFLGKSYRQTKRYIDNLIKFGILFKKEDCYYINKEYALFRKIQVKVLFDEYCNGLCNKIGDL